MKTPELPVYDDPFHKLTGSNLKRPLSVRVADNGGEGSESWSLFL